MIPEIARFVRPSYGTITGSLSLSGTFSLTSNWDTGEFYYTVGTGDQHQEAARSDPGFGTGWQVTPHAEVQLNGNLAVHVIPTASLGINILNGRLNAQANLALDGSVYVELSASLTCAHVAVGDAVRLDASVTGTGFSYPGYNLFSLQHEWYSADVTFGTTKRDHVPTLAVDSLVSDELYGALPYSAYAYEHVYENQLFAMFISDVIVPFFPGLYGGTAARLRSNTFSNSGEAAL
ncbi:hypothetical protein EW026_g5949 [Hermanssonia centrifuga]|uniref:Uncharacterized protein n=1 Tax=Hermanssonia centrifuga TaxID=98765 RepID=A0A4S4KCR9_9APHY|nr:hypothetical protein EW026_g5949 [Hermanssonia centrifuga]